MGVSQGRVRGRRGAALQEAGCTTPGTAGAWVRPWSGAAMVPLTSLLVSYGHGLQMTHIFRTMEAPWNQPGHCRTKLVIFAQAGQADMAEVMTFAQPALSVTTPMV